MFLLMRNFNDALVCWEIASLRFQGLIKISKQIWPLNDKTIIEDCLYRKISFISVSWINHCHGFGLRQIIDLLVINKSIDVRSHNRLWLLLMSNFFVTDKIWNSSSGIFYFSFSTLLSRTSYL